MPGGKSPWVKNNPRIEHPPHLVSLCPASTSSYTLSSWETAVVNQNAGQKMIRRCHSEPATPNNLLQGKTGAAALRSTQRGQGNAKGALELPSTQQRSSTRNDAWGWLVVFMGSFLHGFGHPAPWVEQEQQQRSSFALQPAQAALPTQGLGYVHSSISSRLRLYPPHLCKG